ncbi:AAA family ATPase [Streptomyces sp. NBS 14/10]|uniref:AAA family ATPase n=1 Tax=Streptomyces sp. NBS 14/10 TaxID=1945643 RepID=UPI00211B6927|nr:AAA family ATPase [Streptomyces sp. NBS 14/10]KAK1181335.1 AAA family ATPase [Streptomyces sp. NBS 14/10]
MRLREYRSIAACDVRLGPLTVLVGPNGSGKSNFLDALRLVSEALHGSLEQAVRTRGGMAEIRRRQAGHNLKYPDDTAFVEIILEWADDHSSGVYGLELADAAGHSARVPHEWARVWWGPQDGEEDRPADAAFDVYEGGAVESTEEIMPPPAQHALYLVRAAGVDAFRALFDGLSRINVYSIDPETMRRPLPPAQGEQLERDGANIAAVLHRLEPFEQPSRYREGPKVRIEEYLRLIVPGLEMVRPTHVGAWDSLDFIQESARGEAEEFGESSLERSQRTFSALSVSDGTLRALGVLTALFSDTDGPYSPIGIEEPENTLHPAAAGVLVDAFQEAAEQRQIIITSHSPELLDHPAFGPEQLRAVRQEDGDTVIDKVDRATAESLSDRLFTAGELLRADQLQPTPPLEDDGQ